MQTFNKFFFIYLSFWLLCFFLICYVIVYHPILKENSSKYIKYRSSKQLSPKVSIISEKEGGIKDFWISSKDQRAHSKVTSDFSTLQYVFYKKSPTLLESLYHMEMSIEDSHDFKKVNAKKANFNYATHVLDSYDANLFSYKLENLEKPLFSFVAKKISILFDQTPIAFNATGFSAHLTSGESP